MRCFYNAQRHETREKRESARSCWCSAGKQQDHAADKRNECKCARRHMFRQTPHENFCPDCCRTLLLDFIDDETNKRDRKRKQIVDGAENYECGTDLIGWEKRIKKQH